jgi:hypothetical protein
MRIDADTLVLIRSEFGEYDLSQVCGGDNDVYLRFGYWRRVDTQRLQELVGSGIRVIESDDYDDDCGNLYMYKLLDNI